MNQNIHQVLLSSIRNQNSIYFDFYTFFLKNIDDNRSSFIFPVFDKITPPNLLVVKKSIGDELILIDEFLLLEYLKKKKINYVLCKCLSNVLDVDIFKILLFKYYNIICSSCAYKIRFLKFVYDICGDEECLIKDFLPILNFSPHGKIFEYIKTSFVLSDEVLQYFHKKDLSLNQIYMFSCYNVDLRDTVFALSKNLNLSISLTEEFCEYLNDICIAQDKNIDEVLESLKIKEIMLSNIPTSFKITFIRNMIFEAKYPTITEINKKIISFVKSLNLPKNYDLKWDKMLEGSDLNLCCKIYDIQDIQELKDFLSDANKVKIIEEILKEL